MNITQTKVFICNQLVGTLIMDDADQAFLHYVTAGSNATPDYLNQQEDFDTMLEEVNQWCDERDIYLMMY